MIHTAMGLSAVFIYTAKSVALFAALGIGIFVGLMIQRSRAKRSLERTGKQEAKYELASPNSARKLFYFENSLK